MGDDAPKVWFGSHGKEAIAFVVALATALFGTAHGFFYGSLDVGVHDVGLGPVEVLSQAAVGILAAAAIFVVVAGGCGVLFRMSRGPECRLIEAVFVGAYTVLFLLLIGLYLLLLHAWLASDVIAVVGSTLLLGFLVGFPVLLGREPSWDAAGRWRAVAVFAGIVFVLTLTFLAGVTAVRDAGLVRRGIPPQGILHPLAGGPAPCVSVTWLGTLPASVPALAMHLGEGGGRVVLYAPGRGVVRAPAANVVVGPAADTACRLR